MELYKHQLSRIEDDLGFGETDEVQLLRWGRKLFGKAFRGVFASDVAPRLTVRQPYAIVNTDKKGDPGTHWVALARYKSPNVVFVYDSFGRPTKNLIPWVTKGPLQDQVVDAEYDAEQKDHEANCGQRCLAWLYVFDDLGPDIALRI